MISSRFANSKLAIVTDQRLKSDGDLDEGEPQLSPHVLDFYRPARDALPGDRYRSTHRVAMFGYKEETTAGTRQRARDRLLQYLRSADIRVACVLPTPNVDDENEPQEANTVCWPAFRAPDSLEEMRGTFYEWEPGRYVMPLFPRSPYLKELQLWQQQQWLSRAWDVAAGKSQLQTCPVKCVTPDARMFAALSQMADRPLAVDIENIEDRGIITAIGISDGYYSCAVQWEPYRPYMSDVNEPGIFGHELGREIHRLVCGLLAANTPKIFHNYTFDVPRLEAHGLKLGGPIHDTFAAHGVAYPELRHGLQHACASLLNIRPWKSLYHPKLPGITRDDIEFWIADPLKLLDYNADDAFHTLQLARAVLPHVQQEVFTCNPIKRFA